MKALLDAIKKAGFPKQWKATKETIGLSTKEGKWPIIIDIFRDTYDGKPVNSVEITLDTHDTLDRSEKKLDMAAFKAVVLDVAKLLKVKPFQREVHYDNRGYTVSVEKNEVGVDDAKKLLKKYGKPTVQKIPSSVVKNGVMLGYKIDYGHLYLKFFNDGLVSIECSVY